MNRITARAVDPSVEAEPNIGFGQASPLPAGASVSEWLNGKVRSQRCFLSSTQRVAAFAAPPYALCCACPR